MKPVLFAIVLVACLPAMSFAQQPQTAPPTLPQAIAKPVYPQPIGYRIHGRLYVPARPRWGYFSRRPVRNSVRLLLGAPLLPMPAY